MQNKKITEEIFPLVSCPMCHGHGQEGERRCETCLGAGSFLILAGTNYIWSHPLSSWYIAHGHLEKIVSRLISGFLLLFGVAGAAALIWLMLVSGSQETFFALWQARQPAVFLFWLSLVADFFLIARLERQAEKYKDVVSIFKPPAHRRSKKINVINSFTDSARDVLERAWFLAARFGHGSVQPLHVLAAALETADAAIALTRLEVALPDFANKIRRALARLEKRVAGGGAPDLSPDFRTLPLEAYRQAAINRQDRVRPLELLVASAAAAGSSASEVLLDADISFPRLQNVARWQQINRQLLRDWKKAKRRGYLRSKGMLDRAMTAIATPLLDQVSEDLTLQAKVGVLPPILGRDKELTELFQMIEGGKSSVIFIGEPGVGTTALLHATANRMISEEVPSSLKDKRLVNINAALLVAGASRPGELEQRLEMVLYQLVRAGNVVIAIDRLHNLAGVSSERGKTLDLTEVLSDFVERQAVVLIATTTPDAWRQHLEGRSGLASHLQTIRVEEMEPAQAIPVLEARAGAIEYKHNVYFSYKAVEAAATLAKRYLHDQRLPSSALALLTEAAGIARTKKGRRALVTKEDIAAVVAEKTNIPAEKISSDESQTLLHLEELIHERLIDQEEAVSSVASAMRRSRVELRDVKRPIASFLFLGPTGVGKTQLAKILAKVYFGAEDRMIRLDMSEYQDKGSSERLIGSAATRSGHLTNAVREKSFSLLLLDEIEKAHPDILNLFLQVLDDGRLTDGSGRLIDFTNTIIIGTSNACAEYIQDAVRAGTDLEKMKERILRQELRGVFRPEFLNRFDDVIVFKPLASREIEAITKLLLQEVAKNLDTKGIGFRVTDAAVVELARAGFDPSFGARPLRRVIQERVESPIADLLLSGKISRRDVIIVEEGLILRVEKADRL